MSRDTRRHALTRIGESFNRRNYYRRDANCPATVIYRYEKSSEFARVDTWISNISEGGVLLLLEGMAGSIGDIYVVLPGLPAKVHGKVIRQGELTVAVEFDDPLPSRLVDRIAGLEPRLRASADQRS